MVIGSGFRDGSGHNDTGFALGIVCGKFCLGLRQWSLTGT